MVVFRAPPVIAHLVSLCLVKTTNNPWESTRTHTNYFKTNNYNSMCYAGLAKLYVSWFSVVTGFFILSDSGCTDSATLRSKEMLMVSSVLAFCWIDFIILELGPEPKTSHHSRCNSLKTGFCTGWSLSSGSIERDLNPSARSNVCLMVVGPRLTWTIRHPLAPFWSVTRTTRSTLLGEPLQPVFVSDPLHYLVRFRFVSFISVSA